MIIGATDIKRAFLPEVIPVLVYTSAANYAKPTRRWLQNEFWSYYRARLGALGTWTDKWECWQFTCLYLALLQEANALSPNSPAGATALSAGRWDFKIDPIRPQFASLTPEYHSISCIFTDQGIDRIDPQNNTLWEPTQNEKLATRLLLF